MLRWRLFRLLRTRPRSVPSVLFPLEQEWRVEKGERREVTSRRFLSSLFYPLSVPTSFFVSRC